MPTIDVQELAQELGVPIDEENPIAAIKTIVDTLKDKAANGDQLSQRLEETQNKLDEILHMPALQAPQVKPQDKEVVRRAADLGEPEKALEQVVFGEDRGDPEARMRLYNDTAHLLSRLNGNKALAGQYWQGMLERDPAVKYVTAVTSDGSGYGAEWVPTGFSADVWQDLHLQTLVGGNLEQINMPTLSYKLPYVASNTTAYLTSQATDITTSRFGTEADTLTAQGFGAALYFSGEMEEDSIIPVMPVVRQDIARTLAQGLESALLDGDTTGTHQDSDVTGSTDVRKAWNGFRKLALADAATKTDGTSFQTSTWRAARTAMGKYGISPSDLICVTGPVGFNKLLNLSEVMTVDKYGPNATLLSGELARFDGVPIIVSGQVRENLNASGVYDGSTTTKSYMLLIDRRRFMLGTRRALTIEDDRFILGDYKLVVAKARWAFASRIGVSSTYTTANMIYNL